MASPIQNCYTLCEINAKEVNFLEESADALDDLVGHACGICGGRRALPEQDQGDA